jgi:hypothetical protein
MIESVIFAVQCVNLVALIVLLIVLWKMVLKFF